MSSEDVTGNFVAGMLPDIEHFERGVTVAGLNDMEEIRETDIENHVKSDPRIDFAGMEDGDVDNYVERNDSSSGNWTIFGDVVPKNEVIFICQVVILYIVIVTCIINLSMKNGDSNLWVALLSSSLGIMLPQPSLSQSQKKK